MQNNKTTEKQEMIVPCMGVYRSYFCAPDKFVCNGKIKQVVDGETHIEMPIGDVYIFDSETGKVKNNTQQIMIAEDVFLAPWKG